MVCRAEPCLVAVLAAILLFSSARGDGGHHVGIVDDSLVGILRQHVHTDWDLVPVSTAAPEVLQKASAVVPMFTAATRLPSLLESMPNGRLLQLVMTGTDWLNFTDIPARFALCNVHNAVVAIPEYVLGAVLSWNVQLPQLDAEFRRCAWHGPASRCKEPPFHVQTKGQTMGIVGYGALGSGVAERAAALGMRTIAVTDPLPASTPPPLAWIGNDTMLPKLMEEADFVVVTCPLLASTTGLISAAQIGHMKETGVLINVARGPIVDEAGLFSALKEKRIGGAVLDVWWHDQAGAWPSKFNFSELPNVWMTPHASYHTPQTREAGVKEAAANLDALALGHPLQNVVRPGSPSGFPEVATLQVV